MSGELRLTVEPTGNSFGACRWEWQIEIKEEVAGERWRTVSLKTGEPATGSLADEPPDRYAATGLTYTRFFALREGHKALKRLKKLYRHLAQDPIVVEAQGSAEPSPGYRKVS